MSRCRWLAVLVPSALALALLAAGLGCHDSDPPCDEILVRSDCEAASDCEAQVAWLVTNGFAGPIVRCDVEGFVQCLPATDVPVGPRSARPPDDPANCWITLSSHDLPGDWDRTCDPLPAVPCR